MIPRRTVWAVGLCTLLAPIDGAVAQTQPGAGEPSDVPGTPLYAVLHHRVAVPADASLERGCFVLAHDATLRATLKAAGLHEQRWPCDNKMSSCLAHLGTSPVSFARPGDRALGREALRLQLWRLLAPGDGPSVWWAEGQASGDAPFCGPQQREVEVWPLFAEGTARVARAHIATEGVHPGAREQKLEPEGAPRPVVVDLRHAASELRLNDEALAVADEGVCRPHDALPRPVLVPSERSAIWHVPTRKRRLALTFDACSTYEVGRFNPAVIAALKQHRIPATLFIGGHWAEMFPEELEALASDPLFELGNHTYSHPHMRDLPASTQAQELLWTQQLIYARTGKLPRFFRPPYGEVDDEMLAQVAKAGLVTVEYDLPAGDADVHVSAARLSHWVEGQISPGSVVIMHMNRPGNHTAEALAEIAGELRSRGYSFCRMSSLVDDTEEGCL